MLTLICGQPRAGKTTYSQQFDDVIHLDTSGAYRGVFHIVRERSGDVIVEGVYHSSSHRKLLLQAYKGEGSRCIWLDTPLEVRRKRKGWDTHCDVSFEPPTYSEGWDEIIIIREGDET